MSSFVIVTVAIFVVDVVIVADLIFVVVFIVADAIAIAGYVFRDPRSTRKGRVKGSSRPIQLELFIFR